MRTTISCTEHSSHTDLLLVFDSILSKTTKTKIALYSLGEGQGEAEVFRFQLPEPLIGNFLEVLMHKKVKKKNCCHRFRHP